MAERQQRPSGRQIEADPNEIQNLGFETVSVRRSNVFFSKFQRFRKQEKAWLEHLNHFKGMIIFVMCCCIVACILCGFAFSYEGLGSALFHLGAAAVSFIGFCFYWLFIPDGPPLLSNPNGRMIRSDYFKRFGLSLNEEEEENKCYGCC